MLRAPFRSAYSVSKARLGELITWVYGLWSAHGDCRCGFLGARGHSRSQPRAPSPPHIPLQYVEASRRLPRRDRSHRSWHRHPLQLRSCPPAGYLQGVGASRGCGGLLVINQPGTTANTGSPWALARDFVARRSAGLDFALGEGGAEPACTLNGDVVASYMFEIAGSPTSRRQGPIGSLATGVCRRGSRQRGQDGTALTLDFVLLPGACAALRSAMPGLMAGHMKPKNACTSQRVWQHRSCKSLS